MSDAINQQIQDLAPQFAYWEKTKDLIDQLLDIILNYRQSGHPGGSRSKVHALVATLLSGAMRWDIRHPEKRFGDRFVLVAGHTIPLIYCTLAVLNEALRIKLRADRRQPLRGPRRRRAHAVLGGPARLPAPRRPVRPRRDGGQDPLPEVQHRPLGPRQSGGRRRGAGAQARRRGRRQGLRLRGRGRADARRRHETMNSAWGLALDNLYFLVDWNDFGIDDHPVSAACTARRPTGSAPTAGACSAPSRAATGRR